MNLLVGFTIEVGSLETIYMPLMVLASCIYIFRDTHIHICIYKDTYKLVIKEKVAIIFRMGGGMEIIGGKRFGGTETKKVGSYLIIF